jgi:hypothetical protein
VPVGDVSGEIGGALSLRPSSAVLAAPRSERAKGGSSWRARSRRRATLARLLASTWQALES